MSASKLPIKGKVSVSITVASADTTCCDDTCKYFSRDRGHGLRTGNSLTASCFLFMTTLGEPNVVRAIMEENKTGVLAYRYYRCYECFVLFLLIVKRSLYYFMKKNIWYNIQNMES